MTAPFRRPAARRSRGFTLIELMITVALIAILARIALPAYTSYIQRGKLTEAFNQLSSCSLSLGQFYQDNRTWVGADTKLSTLCPTPTNANFTYSLTTVSATAFKLQAAGSGPVANFTYTVDQTGARATTNVPGGWTTNATCWVNSKSGCQ